MKEINDKIQEYLDTGNYKEEVEEAISKDESVKKYFNEIRLLKDSLSKMAINVDVSQKVLAKSNERRSFYLKLAFSSVASLIIIFAIVFKFFIPNYTTNEDMRSFNKKGAESSPNLTIGIMQTRPELSFSASSEDSAKIIDFLKEKGEIISQDTQEGNINIVFKTMPSDMQLVLEKIKEITDEDLSLELPQSTEPLEVLIIIKNK